MGMARRLAAVALLGLLVGAGKSGLWFGDVQLNPATVSAATLSEQPGPYDLLTFRLTARGQTALTAYTRANVGKQMPLLLDGRLISTIRINEMLQAPYGVATVPDQDAVAILKSIGVSSLN